MRVMEGAGVLDFAAEKVEGVRASSLLDPLSVEEPLEIRLEFQAGRSRSIETVAITMRTPGEDCDLAAGFLFTEGIISAASDLEEVVSEKCNVVRARLGQGVAVDPSLLERHSFVASSCGICGKKSIAAVRVRSKYGLIGARPRVAAEIIHALPATLRAQQTAFAATGGIHASGLFDVCGRLIALREDVGRHNALDKLIGAQLLEGNLPLSQGILLVSGRASFELVQKAAQAGIPVLAAIGAPSSLAVQLAQECGITLLGFVREQRFNIYCGNERISLPE